MLRLACRGIRKVDNFDEAKGPDETHSHGKKIQRGKEKQAQAGLQNKSLRVEESALPKITTSAKDQCDVFRDVK